MLEVFAFLQSYGFSGGGTFGNLLAQWQAIGVFSYVLPFLLLFALVFVILSNVALFKENKGVNVVIALAVSLMSLQFDFVSLFFSEIFPRFGIALAVILVLVIVFALFIHPDTPIFKWLFAIIGLIIAGVVIFKSIYAFGWYTGGTTWMDIYWPNALVVVIIIAAIIAIVGGTGKTKPLPEIGMPPVYGGR